MLLHPLHELHCHISIYGNVISSRGTPLTDTLKQLRWIASQIFGLSSKAQWKNPYADFSIVIIPILQLYFRHFVMLSIFCFVMAVLRRRLLFLQTETHNKNSINCVNCFLVYFPIKKHCHKFYYFLQAGSHQYMYLSVWRWFYRKYHFYFYYVYTWIIYK